MKILLLALNAKYIHTSLALRSIKAYCHPYEEQITVLETTINNQENEILHVIYKEKPDILGISCYIWNMQFVQNLIPTLKKILPYTTLILGGPEVSYESEELLKHLPIDGLIVGEGEETWKDYLDYRLLGKGTLTEIKGLIYKENGQIHRNALRPPMDLDKLPFVYEKWDDFNHKIIYYEASRGCPFNCQYCLSSVEKGVRFVPLEKVKTHLLFFLERHVQQVKFVDRTFNTRKEYAKAIWAFLIEQDNGETNFHFEIAAELLTDDLLEVLKEARPGLIQFEIGVQSTNLKVLDIIQRKMPFEDIRKVVLKVKQLGNIHQHLDLIAGLPEEDYKSFGRSFDEVISVRPEQFQLGFLKVLKGSGLRQNAEKYGLVYKNEPPYEILYTKVLSYEEMIRLHRIEECVERYYNSQRFRLTLDYLFTAYSSPFSFFERLSLFWEAKGYHLMEHNKLAYSTKLIEFCKEEQRVPIEAVQDCLKWDYLLKENISEIPKEWQSVEQAPYKEYINALLKDDTWVKARLPHLLSAIPRQRFRHTRIEYFKYDVAYAASQGTHPILKKQASPIGFLFDYSQKHVSTLRLT